MNKSIFSLSILLISSVFVSFVRPEFDDDKFKNTAVKQVESHLFLSNELSINLEKLSLKPLEKFRIDFNHIAVYDPQTKTWGDWAEGDNTFVININEQGDIAHLKANGETVIYKKLSGVEEGYTDIGNHHYQIIKALDEDGDVFRFQLFDDYSIGLKMMWGEFMIQFAQL
jgi:hypothetical protein